jgi:hypothetical protein
MNTPPIPGFGLPTGPIWHPPIGFKWIVAILVVFLGAVANRLPTGLRSLVLQPVGFFLVSLAALVSYWSGFLPGTLAVLFFLLSVWATQATRAEGFAVNTPTDWVTNSKKWFVEKVLKERPVGIQEKDVSTYPVQD